MLGLIFTYALTYGGAVVALVNPFYGLLIYVSFAIIKPEATWHWSVPPGNYSRIVALAMLAGWVLNGMGRWNIGRARGVLLAFAGFWAWGTISAIVARDTGAALVFTEEIAKVLLPFLVGLTVIDDVRKLKLLAWTIALSQGFLAYEVNLVYLMDGFNRMAHLGMAGVDNNSAALSMAAGVGLAFFLGLGAERLWQRALAFAAALFCGHAVLLSFSRGGMVAMLLTGAVAFVLVARKPRDFAIFAAALLLGVYLAGAEVTERLFTSFVPHEQRDGSAQSRTDLWNDCRAVMERNPVFGAGPFHWRRIAHDYGWPPGKSAHSTWFEVGAEVGLPGLGFLMAMYALCLWNCWKLTRAPQMGLDPFLGEAARMVIAASAGYLVAISFVTAWGIEMGYYIVLLGAGATSLAERAGAAHIVPGPHAYASPAPFLPVTRRAVI